MKILGISAFYHDSAAAIIGNNEIIAAAQEERFSRRKHDPSFPTNAIRYCLEESGFSIDELDAIVFYDKPLLKFERLLETYYIHAPKGIKSFLTAIPVWIREKLFMKKKIRQELMKIEKYDKKKLNLLFSEHHLSHAASAFYPSPFKKAAILTIDGVGEWATASICLGNDNKIKVLKELNFPHSLGLLYSSFTYYLGFKVNSGEYKLMGLAPYGAPNSKQLQEYVKLIKDNIVKIHEDGSISLNQMYFDYASGMRMANDNKWERLFLFPKRIAESELKQEHCNLALAIQQVTEEIVEKMAIEAKRLTGAKYLCMAGGVALNCVSNGKLLRKKIFNDIFIQPAAGDAGGALGAALATKYIYFSKERLEDENSMKGAYLGPDFSDKYFLKIAKKKKAKYRYYEDFVSLIDTIAKLLDEGNIIGWFQGRMEYGPRALGNRSILGDARNPEMQKKLNLKIKYRESFRPFAPSILEDEAANFFDIESSSPFMLTVQPVHKERRNKLTDNYEELPLKDKLYFLRSDIPAVTHIDFSARIQTVHSSTNQRYYQLIDAFRKRTGYGLLVNTSFNVRGEPIVCTPEDAYNCFMRTEMDYLVIGNFFLDKKWQLNTDKQFIEQKEFKLD